MVVLPYYVVLLMILVDFMSNYITFSKKKNALKLSRITVSRVKVIL